MVLVALALSMVGGVSTAIGALLVVVRPTPKLNRLGILQGFAAGLMLCISFMDLAHNAINAIGFFKANVWFFVGVIAFATIVTFIPEPNIGPSQPRATAKKAQDKKDDDFSAGKDLMKKRRKQVLFSGIITAVGISLHNFPEGIAVFLGSLKGLRVGISLALAIALHNIPEGIAVALPVYYATESIPLSKQLVNRDLGRTACCSWWCYGFPNFP